MRKVQSDTSLPQMLTDNFQKMANISLEAMQPLVENMTENLSNLNKTFSESGLPVLNILGAGKKSKCCPPEEICPPHCIATINKQAMAGERIIVPIVVTNNCNSQKTYRVGIRELKDVDGNAAPAQPQLNKTQIQLEPGRSERILMTLDLANFPNGSIYETEVVLREREINQNICFTLHVNDNNFTEVTPYDEKKFKLKWQDWQSHFYCEPPKRERNATLVNNEASNQNTNDEEGEG
ncbi:hypothetical protein EI546_13615 [Aequorivita sp. H23M31]|uniref:Uncharacterized protein n=1 Tax=Aequorivita ciconiae TaxID=2494375 RepID=A0A410G5Z3_9FLAO|nr:hypothetical protein [Aequorivita sp. H23M31]QAA82692.1 hypothetical protein EI546_13615 [Aequorivita sp. H23M31]